MEDTAIIAKIPLFQDLPPDRLKDLASIAVVKSVGRGETIFTEGQQAEGFYAVVSGMIKIYKVSPDGKEQILHIFGPGEPFAEVPVFEGGRFPANAMAMQKSKVCFFPRKAFVELIKRNPALSLGMMAVLSRRLRRFAALIDNLSLKEVPGRLAAHIIYLSDRAGGAHELNLDIPKNQLAGMLGTIPETLSRILTKMIQQGLISSEGRRITILNRDGLEQLSEGTKRLGE
ncbi:Crp/Fnr family transcriptional regulator [Thermodesulfobacteriota bacterium]